MVTVNSRHYTFKVQSRSFTLLDSIVDADFEADPLE